MSFKADFVNKDNKKGNKQFAMLNCREEGESFVRETAITNEASLAREGIDRY